MNHAHHTPDAAMAHTNPHTAQGHGGQVEHSGHMGHDMSDPAMAAAMERDMRTKFLLALVLTIPNVLYSPMGMNLFGIALPTFGLSMDVIMLALTTPVIFGNGWVFLSGAFQALRRRTLDMSVLVASSSIVAVNAVLLRGVEGKLRGAASKQL